MKRIFTSYFKQLNGREIRGVASPVPGRVVASYAVKGAGEDLTEVTLTSVLCESDGFVYLKIADGIIDSFIELIQRRGIERPEKASDEDYVGAHISVMRSEEYKRVTKGRKKLKEIGEEFDFTLDKLYVTEPNDWDDVQEVYFISVKSPQLEALRRKYGLSKLLNGHDFHISVAVKQRG